MTTHIRISAVTPTVQAVADGASKSYEFPFPIFGNDDLEVFVGDSMVANGFAVRGAGSSDGGAIIFATAPATGQRVTIRRRQTYARTDDFLDERAPTPHELNDAVDQNVAAIQELADESALAVKRSPTADQSREVNLTLPEPEAGRVLGWNGSADALVNLVQVDASDMLRKSQNLADLPDKAQARINLGLGSAATHPESDFATAAQGAKADSALQAADIGVSIQAHDGDLDWVAANVTSAGKALLDDADAAAQRVTLGLGSAATKDVGTAANQVVQLDGGGKLPAVDGSQLLGLPGGSAPTGAVISFAGITAPSGWLLCDGSVISRTTYADLFAAIGTTFGAGDGSSTFLLPDLRGRTIIGAGQGSGLTSRTLGATVGTETHTLTIAEIPSHSHSLPTSGENSGTGIVFGGIGGGSSTGSAGGGGSHNNMQPSLVLNYIIKT